MPEGDSIFRAAHTLNQALAGRAVLRFDTVFPALTRIDADRPIRGRLVEQATARGKHLLIAFSGGLVLRTHLRLHGSWHIYRTGERWQRPYADMRIVIGTDAYEAVAFNVPDAELLDAAELQRDDLLPALGPDLLSDDFDPAAAVSRLRNRADMEIGEALLDQHALAGIGNIWKSETLFAAGINPFARVAALPDATLDRIVRTAQRLLAASAAGSRNVQRSVYMRGGQPCRRCGTPIQRRRQGANARATYWCERCQPR